MLTVKVGFIGAGNMAKAIAFGLIDAGAIEAKNIFASAPTMNHLKSFSDIGINVTHNNNDIIKNCDIVFLAIKPQYLDVAISSLNDIPNEGKLYISILAGVKLETFEKKFQTHCRKNSNYKIIRVLPNTPILVGAGCTVMAPNAHTTQEEVSLVKEIMSYGGSCELVPEHLISPCSAVCGSGPAFMFMVIEALADGAVLCGVPRDLAIKLAARTLEGAGKLVSCTMKHPGQLKDEVCSPGGTTIVGVNQLEESGVRSAFMKAVRATADRSAELSKLA